MRDWNPWSLMISNGRRLSATQWTISTLHSFVNANQTNRWSSSNLISAFVCGQVKYVVFPFPFYLKAAVIVLFIVHFLTASCAMSRLAASLTAIKVSSPQHDLTCLHKLLVDPLSPVLRYHCTVCLQCLPRQLKIWQCLPSTYWMLGRGEKNA